jgi:hypothetical protein
MGSAGSERARTTYSWQRVAALTEQSYARAARRSSRTTDLLEVSA